MTTLGYPVSPYTVVYQKETQKYLQPSAASVRFYLFLYLSAHLFTCKPVKSSKLFVYISDEQWETEKQGSSTSLVQGQNSSTQTLWGPYFQILKFKFI